MNNYFYCKFNHFYLTLFEFIDAVAVFNIIYYLFIDFIDNMYACSKLLLPPPPHSQKHRVHASLI